MWLAVHAWFEGGLAAIDRALSATGNARHSMHSHTHGGSPTHDLDRAISSIKAAARDLSGLASTGGTLCRWRLHARSVGRLTTSSWSSCVDTKGSAVRCVMTKAMTPTVTLSPSAADSKTSQHASQPPTKRSPMPTIAPQESRCLDRRIRQAESSAPTSIHIAFSFARVLSLAGELHPRVGTPAHLWGATQRPK